ncbi:MAG: putative acyl--CoA ligase YhfT [Alphaproteobacteria bacterium MarineAlpha4_Bin2]|nr:MAG: putative acyl--CoA ligase YhfT [Alphaproteobacteria bacterium MarineAlpha4_Bin2]
MIADRTAVDRAMTDIATVIRHHAMCSPEDVALEFDGSHICWREFVAGIDALAQRFAGMVLEDRIAFSLPNEVLFVQAMFAAVKAGKCFQVLDPEWPDQTVNDVVTTLQPNTLINESNLDLLVQDVCSARVDPKVWPQVNVCAPFYTGFTSGSTGMPKGFRRDQKSWLESFRRDGEIFNLSREDVFVSLGSLAHSLFVYAVFRGLYAGAKTIFYRRFRPDRIIQSIARSGGTVIYGVPTQFDALIAAAHGGLELSSVRLVLTSGAKLPTALHSSLNRLFPKAAVCEFYGTSEQSYITFARDNDSPLGSVGRPFPGVDIRILDDSGNMLPAGSAGRVFVDSPLLFDGYELADNPTMEWCGDALFVGDVGYLDEDGFLYLAGRADRMIVCSGKNIYPEEIEAVLAAHPAVSRACVIGVSDSRRGQRPVALLQIAPELSCSMREIKSWCREQLPLYKIPSQIYEIDEWPMTVSQKTDVPRLTELLRLNGLWELR